MLFIHDKETISPKKIPFVYILEEIIAWTKHGVLDDEAFLPFRRRAALREEPYRGYRDLVIEHGRAVQEKASASATR